MTDLNPPEPILVYLATPIDQNRGPARMTGWGVPLSMLIEDTYGALTQADPDLGVDLLVFRPREAFYTSVPDRRVEQINRHALYLADAIVAVLPAGIPTIGVPAEIEAATARGIPAVVLHDGISQALAGNPLVTVVDTISSICDAVQHAVRVRAKQVSGLQLVVRDGMALPTRAYDDDAGIDLNTAIGVAIEPGGYADVRTQVDACQLPPNSWGFVTGRSSTIRKRGIHVPTGVIDPGWRGPLYVGAYNLTSEPVHIRVGERLGQLILVPTLHAPVVQVDQVSDHPRGQNGFGSSGA